MAWVDDDFTGNDGSAPDPVKWIEDDSNNKLDIQSNALDFDSQESSDTSANLDSIYDISGDFDIQIDVSEVDGANPSASIHYGSFRIISSSSAISSIAISRTSSGKLFTVSGTSTSLQNISRAIDSTKLRITRSGTTIKGFYWSGAQWEWDGSTNGFTFGESYSEDITIRIYNKQEGVGSARWHVTYDNFMVNSGTISLDLQIEDFSLDLAAYYQNIDDLKMLLQAHDGLEYRDFQMILEAIGATNTYADFVMELAALSQKNESLKVIMEAAKDIYKNFKMMLEATDGTVFNDFMMIMKATDGITFNNFGMHLQAISATPAFRSVTAQRLSSIVHEVV
jgi:hypothetical protein